MSRTHEAIIKHAGLSLQTTSQTMKAIRIHNYGALEVLKYEDAPRPQVSAAGEVLIRVYAAGVNPVDCAIRAGRVQEIFPVSFPWIPGWDLSGVVEELGPDVTKFDKGDEVFAIPDTTRNGAYAEYIVARESDLALKPKSLHHIRAAAVPVAAITAWNVLFDTAQLQPGQRVLIHSGAGGVGHFAVQLAKRKGAHVIATASAKNHELVYELGELSAVWPALNHCSTCADCFRHFLRWRLHNRNQDSALLQNFPGTFLRVAANRVEDNLDVARDVFEFLRVVIDYLIGAEFGDQLMIFR